MQCSNIVTEQLEGKYTFSFDDDRAYSKREMEQQNCEKYFLSLKRDYDTLFSMLDLISINEYIKDKNRAKFVIDNIEDEEEKKATIESFDEFFPAMQKAFLNKKQLFDDVFVCGKHIFDYSYTEATNKLFELMRQMDEIYSQLEKNMPSFIVDFMSSLSASLEATPDASIAQFEQLMENNSVFGSAAHNLSRSIFADLFIKKVIQKLIDTKDLDCLEGLYYENIDPDCISIITEVMDEAAQELKDSETIKSVPNLDPQIYDEAFRMLKEKLFTRLESHDNILGIVGRYLQAQEGVLHEFHKNFYETFGNVIALPIADTLRNCLILADNDLVAYCDVNKIDINLLLIDIPSRLKDGYYYSPNYSNAIEMDKKARGEE